MPQPVLPAQLDALRDPLANRGTAFDAAARERLGLSGFLPPRIETLDEQAARALAQLRAAPDALARYERLAALQNDNETLFLHLLGAQLQELLPVVYTPTVGEACLRWSRLYARPRGLYLTAAQRGRYADILRRWPQREVGVIVVTDGGRILGLGDLGANGMGIPIGKLALYGACGGLAPAQALPVMLDVGCDTAPIRDDPFYLGTRAPRLRAAEYDTLVDEFVDAVREVFPGALLQFEDFANADAFRLLARHRNRLCCFNDDIQGTGAMGLAGLRAASRLTGRALADERLLFVGAGEAGLGMGALVVAALQREGIGEAQARERCLFADSQGLVVASRADLPPHKRAFAPQRAPQRDLRAAIAEFRPTVLVGASGQGGLFTQGVLQQLAAGCERPVVFALSNPTSKAECSAEQAYAATGGRALFAAGSPFEPVSLAGRTHHPGQANNAYVFPGVGLGLRVAGATRVSDAMFLAAADALAGQVGDADLAAGRLYPPQARLREVARAVAVAVAGVAHDEVLASRPRPADLPAAVDAAMWRPAYPAP